MIFLTDKKSFMLYVDNYKQFKLLSDEQAGMLIKSLFFFSETGDIPEIADGTVMMAFSFISAQMERDNERYKQTCKKRSENAKARWDKNEDAKNANGCNCINENAKYADTDKDTDKDTDTDTDIYTSQPAKPSQTPHSKINAEEVIDMYHEICKSYPKIKSISEARRKAVRARLRTYGLGEFRTVFSKAEESDFLKGKNGRNWSATFDWIIKDSNFAKILDGNYDNKSHSGYSSKNSSDVDKYKCVINQFDLPGGQNESKDELH